MKYEHGTMAMYRQKCRCWSCREANADWHQEYRRNKNKRAHVHGEQGISTTGEDEAMTAQYILDSRESDK